MFLWHSENISSLMCALKTTSPINAHVMYTLCALLNLTYGDDGYCATLVHSVF